MTNTERETVTFTMSREDFSGDQSDPRGTPKLLGGKLESKISGYDWLVGFPRSIAVPSGQSRTFPVTVAPPTGATGGHYAALIVSGPTRSSNGVFARSRMGVLFMMNAGGVAPPELVVSDIETESDGSVRVIYENQGSTNERPDARFTPTSPLSGDDPTGPRSRGTCTESLPGGLGECTFAPGTQVGDGEGLFSSGSERGADGGSTLAGRGGSGVESIARDGYVELTTGAGDKFRGNLPTTWAGGWAGFLLPALGLGGIAWYFAFLRRRKSSADEDELLA